MKAGIRRLIKMAVLEWISYIRPENPESMFHGQARWYLIYQSNKECTGEVALGITEKPSGSCLPYTEG